MNFSRNTISTGSNNTRQTGVTQRAMNFGILEMLCPGRYMKVEKVLPVLFLC